MTIRRYCKTCKATDPEVTVCHWPSCPRATVIYDDRDGGPEGEKPTSAPADKPPIECTRCGKSGDSMEAFRGCTVVACTNGGLFDCTKRDSWDPSAVVDPAPVPTLYERGKALSRELADVQKAIIECSHEWIDTRDELVLITSEGRPVKFSTKLLIAPHDRYGRVAERECGKCGLRQQGQNTDPKSPIRYFDMP